MAQLCFSRIISFWYKNKYKVIFIMESLISILLSQPLIQQWIIYSRVDAFCHEGDIVRISLWWMITIYSFFVDLFLTLSTTFAVPAATPAPTLPATAFPTKPKPAAPADCSALNTPQVAPP